jgi:methylthioribose-1-phosphate isomerase
MKIGGAHYRTIWPDGDGVRVIDQTRLPFAFEAVLLQTCSDATKAIRDMIVRGAPLIGATAAWGVALAMRADASDASLDSALRELGATRPTAVNLRWALERMANALRTLPVGRRNETATLEAMRICDEDVECCRAIGFHGLLLLRDIAQRKGHVNILTHCNAGWLATVDFGTALSTVYQAHDSGIDLHVWVDETRPRNQGASLTAFELGAHGVKHTIIADNAGGHYMQHGQVDMVIVGTDRVAANGDVANKIGTYLKALAAYDNVVPFYVALPSSTIDWTIDDGLRGIPIEERNPREVTHIQGLLADGSMAEMQVTAPGSAAANPAFDVTPARLVTGFITERGLCAANADGLRSLFPELSA